MKPQALEVAIYGAARAATVPFMSLFEVVAAFQAQSLTFITGE